MERDLLCVIKTLHSRLSRLECSLGTHGDSGDSGPMDTLDMDDPGPSYELPIAVFRMTINDGRSVTISIYGRDDSELTIKIDGDRVVYNTTLFKYIYIEKKKKIKFCTSRPSWIAMFMLSHQDELVNFNCYIQANTHTIYSSYCEIVLTGEVNGTEYIINLKAMTKEDMEKKERIHQERIEKYRSRAEENGSSDPTDSGEYKKFTTELSHLKKVKKGPDN